MYQKGGGTMAQGPDNKPGNGSGNSPEYIPEENVYAYNLDDSTTPGGIKVRFKIRVETGAKARHWNDRQNAAIKEILQWARNRQDQQPRR
jgi:hypothetical protein